jgi:hypothetical protein
MGQAGDETMKAYVITTFGRAPSKTVFDNQRAAINAAKKFSESYAGMCSSIRVVEVDKKDADAVTVGNWPNLGNLVHQIR